MECDWLYWHRMILIVIKKKKNPRVFPVFLPHLKMLEAREVALEEAENWTGWWAQRHSNCTVTMILSMAWDSLPGCWDSVTRASSQPGSKEETSSSEKQNQNLPGPRKSGSPAVPADILFYNIGIAAHTVAKRSRRIHPLPRPGLHRETPSC